MYDHDPAEVTVLGWEEFVLQLWASIFVGYQSWAGLRTQGRRWSDLIEAGLGCSQEVADGLVKAIVIDGPVRRLDGAVDPMGIVAGMIDVLAAIPAALTSADNIEPGVIAGLLDRHARLLGFITDQVLGDADGGDSQLP
ncbi:MAG TPA: hypothetical protein VEL03_16905 [Streptosporangiaceae bacterium]|nr:hypothetical protein [Streptosporangiaceae bacterium]